MTSESSDRAQAGDIIQIGDLPKVNFAILTDRDGRTVAIKFYRGEFISVVLADGPMTENDNDILRARRELVREGLVVDSGLRKLEPTGRYEILWRIAQRGAVL